MAWRFYPDDAYDFKLVGTHTDVMVQVKFVIRRILESRAALMPIIFVDDSILNRLISHLQHFYCTFQAKVRYDHMPLLSRLPKVITSRTYPIRSTKTVIHKQKYSSFQLDQLENIFQASDDVQGMFFQYYDIYRSDCERLTIVPDTRQMFGQLMNLKFPTYRLKSTGSKASHNVKIVSGVKPINVDIIQFRELGLDAHFDNWIEAECQLDPNLDDWSILLKLNFNEFSRNTFYDQESANSFGRHILALPGVSKKRVDNINAPQYILVLYDAPPRSVTKYRGIKRKHPDQHDVSLEQNNNSTHTLLYQLFVTFPLTPNLRNLTSFRINGSLRTLSRKLALEQVGRNCWQISIIF